MQNAVFIFLSPVTQPAFEPIGMMWGCMKFRASIDLNSTCSVMFYGTANVAW